jgi:hypothetical protein
VKKKITAELRAMESNIRAAQRGTSRQQEKEAKAAVARAKEAELLHIRQANANAEALAKLLKGEATN